MFENTIFTKESSKFLAREALITLNFAERIRRQTKRSVVVIPIGKTGVPYTWGIEALKPSGIELEQMLNYPSSAITDTVYTTRFNKIMNIFKRKNNPILIFVDSSREPRMPSSFAGHPRNSQYYTSAKNSLQFKFQQNGFRVIIARNGFARGLISETFRSVDRQGSKPKIDKLPRNFDIRKGEKTVILLNPSKERTIKIGGKKWGSALHDDATSGITPEFKEHTINQLKFWKK